MTDQNTYPPLPLSTDQPRLSSQEELQRRRSVIGLVILGIVLVGLLIALFVYLIVTPNGESVTRIRDIFIIFMALESLLLGVVLVILIIQLARLINLLNNEIKPILESTNHTVDTLRGTTAFLSNNLVEPVMKLNEYLAALQKMFALVGIGVKKSNK